MFKKLALVGPALGIFTMQAHAALPAAVSTAIDAVEADGILLVGLVAAAGAAVYLIAKVLGRFGMKL